MEILSYIASELKQHKDAIQGAYYLMLAIFGGIGLYFLHRRNTALHKSSDASVKQAEIAKISQINDQYVKAVDQLVSDNIAINLGGIYGLEQIAQSYERFYTQVVELLTAYVREKAVQYDDTEFYRPAKDIQAILTVLGRCDNKDRVTFDLSGTYLSEYLIQGDFSNANFSKSDFTNADFSFADLSYANCAESNFTNANCHATNFTRANCRNANFTNSNCNHADFNRSKLTKTNFTSASGDRAIFDYANCDDANFTDAFLIDADFIGAYCERTIFIRIDCTRANFTDARLMQTNFTDANDLYANFTNANKTKSIGIERV